MPSLPDLNLLRPDLLPKDVKISHRALRLRAKQLGQFYIISRRAYVSDEQLAAIIESYRQPSTEHLKLSSVLRRLPKVGRTRSADETLKRVMKRLDEAERERKRREREGR